MGGKNSTSTSSVNIPPEVLQRYNAVNARAETVAQQPFQSYPGQFVAGLTGTQQAGIQNTNSAAGAAQPFINAGAGLTLGSAQDLQPDQYSGDAVNQYMSPYLKDVYDTTAANIDRSNAVQQNSMLGDSIKANAFGGDRSGIARAELARTQNLAGQQTLAGILQGGFQSAQGEFNNQQQINLGADQNTAARMAAAGSSLGSLGVSGQQSALAGAAAQMQAGQVEQGTQQADLTAQYNQFLQDKSYPFQVAQFLANIAMGTGALSGSTTTSTSPAPFFSDERLKENIVPVGQTFDGQTIHRYNYKGDPRTQIGLLAQDVAHHAPHAVGADRGYLTVDYDKATRHAAGLSGAVAHRASGGGLQIDPYASPGGDGRFPRPMSYVPPAALPVAGLVTAKVPEQKQSSGLADAAKSAQSISTLAKDGKELYKWARPDGPAYQTVGMGADDPMQAIGNNLFSRGGYADGGDASDISDDYPDAPMAGRGPDVHSFVPKADLPVAGLHPADAPKGGSGSGGLGDMATIAASAAKILPYFLAASRGGGIGHYAGGGAAIDYSQMDPDEAMVRTLVREAGNEPDDGLAGVAHVAQNRVNKGSYGDGLVGVLTKPRQFTPWTAAGTGSSADPMTVDMSSPQAQRAAAIWQRVKSGEIPDPTGGAVNFANRDTVHRQGVTPGTAWVDHMENPVVIGHHTFGTAGHGGQDSQMRATYPARPLEVRKAPMVIDAPPQAGLAGAAPQDEGYFGSAMRKLTDPSDDNMKLSLLSGLFGMLSSKSHWLLPAIGEGGQTAIQTYQGLKKNDADIANTWASRNATNVDTIKKSLDSRMGPYQVVIDENGNPKLVQNFRDNPSRIAGQNGTLGAPPPAPVPNSRLTPPPVAAPAAGTSAAAQRANAPLPPRPGDPAPAVPRGPTRADLTPPVVPVPAGLPARAPNGEPADADAPITRDFVSAAQAEGRNMGNIVADDPRMAEAIQRSKEKQDAADHNYGAARAAQQAVNELAVEIAHNHDNGDLSSGPGFNFRARAAAYANMAFKAAGLPEAASESNIGSAEIQAKLRMVAGGQNAQAAQQGHVAAYLVDQFMNTVPSGELQLPAQRKLMAQIMVQNQMFRDQKEALDAYRRYSGAGLPGRGTAQDFEQQFNRDFSDKYYNKLRAAIEEGYGLGTRDVKQKDGKVAKINIMEAILQGKVKPAEIDKMLKMRGASRVFTGTPLNIGQGTN